MHGTTFKITMLCLTSDSIRADRPATVYSENGISRFCSAIPS